MTSIVSEIANASNDQSAGIEEINKALTHMDETTQQNSALVEEMAAAAMGLKRQSNELVTSVERFNLPSSGAAREGNPSLSPGLGLVRV